MLRDRSTLALRISAVAAIVKAIALLAAVGAQEVLGVRASAGTAVDAEKLFEQLKLWGWVSTGTTMVAGVTLVAGAYLMTPRTRRLGWTAVALLATSLLLTTRVFWPAVELDLAPAVRKLLRLAEMVTLLSGLFAMLLAGRRAVGGGRGDVLLWVFGWLAATLLALGVASLLTNLGRDTWRWIHYGIFLGALLAFSAAALGLTKASGGRALRSLGNAILVRLVLSIGGAIALRVMVAVKWLDSAQIVVTALGAASFLTGFWVVAALGQSFSLPSRLRLSGALGFSMLALVILAVVDLVVAESTVRLLGIAAEVNRSSTLWGVSGLSDARGLQRSLKALGAGSLVLGVSAMIAILQSLRHAAEMIQRQRLAEQAMRATTLIVFGGTGALALSLAAGEIRSIHILLYCAVALLVVAIFAIRDVLQVIFRLAGALDTRAGDGVVEG